MSTHSTASVAAFPDQDEWRASHEPPPGREMVRHYLRDLVYGANDGIITTFAVVAGVAGAALAPRTALILGMANLLADGFSMAAGNFLSIRSEEAVLVARGEPGREPFPVRHAFATLLAFVIAGAVPLLPYVLSSQHRFVLAAASTLACLFAVGALRAVVTELRWWFAGLEMLTVGAAAAIVAYVVGAWIAPLT
jgi:VIT1/CCC1 family predicted Fe2+/Mn2+ transporter